MNQKVFQRFLKGKKTAILGYGREGRSTYANLRKYLPELSIVICDQNDALHAESAVLSHDIHTSWHLGDNYLKGLENVDLIIKSPGIPFKVLGNEIDQAKVSSQTELFVRLYRNQITGITGTKGKSTTCSLLHHMLEEAGIHSLLLGNIGVPPFDMIDHIRLDTHIVYEMSSHQLEHVRFSPKFAAVMNIFKEHLDHYPTYEHYQQAKLNIARWQSSDDILLYNCLNEKVTSLINNANLKARRVSLGRQAGDEEAVYFQNEDLHIKLHGGARILKGLFRENPLPGLHNRVNISAAAFFAFLHGANPKNIKKALGTFRPIPHRLELVGYHQGVWFYNDSISTIPESAMAALEALPQTSALILGGYDRGVDYDELINYVDRTEVNTVVFTGPAGCRMLTIANKTNSLKGKQCILARSFDEAFQLAVDGCGNNGTCLLSPAAASYDAFKNFEERGERFRSLVEFWDASNR